MSLIGERQSEILRHAMEAPEGRFTKKEIVDLLGKTYFWNSAKHLGEVLSRMVRQHLIVREKRGHYRLNVGWEKRARPLGLVPVVRPEENPNQLDLFGG